MISNKSIVHHTYLTTHKITKSSKYYKILFHGVAGVQKGYFCDNRKTACGQGGSMPKHPKLIVGHSNVYRMNIPLFHHFYQNHQKIKDFRHFLVYNMDTLFERKNHVIRSKWCCKIGKRY